MYACTWHVKAFRSCVPLFPSSCFVSVSSFFKVFSTFFRFVENDLFPILLTQRRLPKIIHLQLNFPNHHLIRTNTIMGSSGEKSAKKAKKEKRDKPESGSSKKRGRDGLPVPSTPGDEDEETGALNPVCAIASPLADGKLTKKALKVVKKGTRVLFFFVQQRGERRRRFFF